MLAGPLDRRIQLQRASTVDGGMARRPGAFATFATVSAQAMPTSDAERLSADARESTIDMRFHIRWSTTVAGLGPEDQAVFDGRTYGIVGVKELGRREGLEISATAKA